MSVGRKTVLDWATDPFCWRPVVQMDEGVLLVRSSFFQKLITLFSCEKRLRVDTQSRSIDFQTRSYWFRRDRTTIPFENVGRIDYSFSDTGSALFLTAIEVYSVSLALVGIEEKLRLFSFIGRHREPCTDAEITLEMIVGNSDHECSGVNDGQGVSSREFIRLLQASIGAPLI